MPFGLEVGLLSLVFPDFFFDEVIDQLVVGEVRECNMSPVFMVSVPLGGDFHCVGVAGP